MRKKLHIKDVVNNHLCTGCGACSFIAPQEITMVDTINQSRRPLIKNSIHPESVQEALKVCPGIGQTRDTSQQNQAIPELIDEWGTILEVWEAHASDSTIRFRSSSGGVITALSLYCLEQETMSGSLQISGDDNDALLNQTKLNTSREEILNSTGSRYSPASPCDSLSKIENADNPCVMVGKPCDVLAASNAAKIRSKLDQNLGLKLSVFCAGTPSVEGVISMTNAIQEKSVSNLAKLRFRGMGWPGFMTGIFRNQSTENTEVKSMSYAKGWGNYLQKYRQWRCHMCADHTGEAADISIGDPWYRPVDQDEKGSSLLLVRTERGKEILHKAVKAGYVTLRSCPNEALPLSQKHLQRTRGAVWARVLMSQMIGLAAPKYKNMKLFQTWMNRLNVKEKIQSLTGTLKRIFKKNIHKTEEWKAYSKEAALKVEEKMKRNNPPCIVSKN